MDDGYAMAAHVAGTLGEKSRTGTADQPEASPDTGVQTVESGTTPVAAQPLPADDESRTTSAPQAGSNDAGNSEGGGSRNGYANFREMLKHPSAQPVIAQIKNFVLKFPSGLSRNEASRRVHKFLTSTQEWMLTESVVFAADADEEGRVLAAEGLEKFLLSRLYSKLFAVDPADVEEDVRIRKHTAGLQWVSFKNLGIPPVEPALLKLAIQQLQSIDTYKAPKDKLTVILNSCRVIHDVLKRTRAEGGRPLAADDFLPLLIYAVIQANPPRLHSNVEFVASFRHPSRLNGEEAYYLTSLSSAVAFVRDANAKVLDVTPEEYEQRYATCLSVFAAQEAAAQEQLQADGAPAVVDAPTTVAAKAALLTPTERQTLNTRLQALPLRFEAIEQPKMVRIKDVTNLLEEYREMVRMLRDVDSGAILAHSGVQFR